MKLRKIAHHEVTTAMSIINDAKKHLKEQGIDQWQTGYPDKACIEQDAHRQTGYFVTEQDNIIGYLCIDFSGEPAYAHLKGTWASQNPYVVIHRMAFCQTARGKHLSDAVFHLVEQLSLQKNIHYFRVDTDAANRKMQHVLHKNGFTFRGIIWFDNSEKMAFDKQF